MDEGNGLFRIEFTTVEVGSYVIDVTVKELTVPNSPLIAKAYDAGLIKVTDIQDGIVGDLSTFRVDASKAGITNSLYCLLCCTCIVANRSYLGQILSFFCPSNEFDCHRKTF